MLSWMAIIADMDVLVRVTHRKLNQHLFVS